MKLEARPSKVEDIIKISQNMRPEDVRECLSGGLLPIKALEAGYINSEYPMTGESSEGPEVMWGAVRVTPPGTDVSIGIIWLLGTVNSTTKAKWSFLRQSKLYLEDMANRYDLLFNYVDSRNTVHIKWLEWLGFKFLNKTTDFSVDGTVFYKFVRVCKHV